ncbi:MAG: xanthine dehydrogenase accessory protein XdhC [Telluria sp.]
MDDWLTAMAAGPAVLVTVAQAEGSVPREPGAKMLVDAAHLHGTIGGGHLEHRALEAARAMLADGRMRHFERYALGPTLGQCCGGVAWLAFERVDAAYAEQIFAFAGSSYFRLAALDGEPETHVTAAPRDGLPLFDSQRGTHVLQEQDGRRWLVDRIEPPHAHLVLFGAGHVGAAIVRALAPLPCTVTWVDERDDLFPADVPANVTIEATDTPEAAVAAAPAHAVFLVMTHSHALDQRLSEAILARPQLAWFGLIGSMTKRRQFEHRLRARGVDEQRLVDMVCPIGVPGIKSKLPAVIAASVAAQLLAVWEAQQAAGAAGAPPLRLVASGRT